MAILGKLALNCISELTLIISLLECIFVFYPVITMILMKYRDENLFFVEEYMLFGLDV